MEDTIEWKEAKGGQRLYESEDEEAEENFYTKDAAESELGQAEEFDDAIDDQQDNDDNDKENFSHSIRPNSPSFQHQKLLLNLRRNITSLGDPKYHKPKPAYASDKSVPFVKWIEDALVAISPTADFILFSGQVPEKTTFFAKLRMEPINQYVTKPLHIPLDYNEYVTSLLCLPFMSTQKTASGIVDWTVLVIGLSSGYVKFYTEQNVCLLSLKFCDEPVLKFKCQTQKSNPNGRSESHFPTIVDELLVIQKTLAVLVDGIGLYENLRIAKNEVIRSNSTYEPAYNLTNLPSLLNCQKWIISDSRDGPFYDADMLGTRKTTVFDSLLSESINMDHVPAKVCGRSLVFVGKNPFIGLYKESNDNNSHSYTEIIGSIFSLWNKPQPSTTQIVEVTKYNHVSMYDRDRLATSIVSSPDKRLAAMTDDFGRVLLVDCANWLVVRMWKGYRTAQCGWIEVKRSADKRGCPHALFLVIYAPKRGLLEVWSAQRGPRVAAFNVGKNCRLLYSGYNMFNMIADKGSNILHPIEQSYSNNCYLLNAESETIFSIEVPYTYSLYKYGDLKSRDHLLIGELNQAIQNDNEIELVSEILHRVALPESLQISIHKIVLGLAPIKIVPIMENLINKTMKNYDNHSGETMTEDDLSIIELCKRVIRLCSMFTELSESSPQEFALPDVNQRLIEEYEEHPGEIDEFSDQLGWSSTEILRYLSLISLERSYSKNYLSNPWPSLGEPLTWNEFISCFDLTRIKTEKKKKGKKETRNLNKPCIRLKESNSEFLIQDKVIKTSLFMYNRLGENFFSKGLQKTDKKTTNNYNYLEPSSRLGLLFQFWLSTKLCNHWKMWIFLQDQVGQISDELKVIAMDKNDDSILIDSWKQIYNLILESDNIFAAITATAAIRSDTLRMIADNEKREKLASQNDDKSESPESTSGNKLIDWECLCIDAERMSLLCQQLEDVFLLNMLLRYSVSDGRLRDNYFVYKVPRISVANILRGGQTIVTELVSQWAIQTKLNLKIFTQPYGLATEENLDISIGASTPCQRAYRKGLYNYSNLPDMNNEEHAKELLHHTITSFPSSLEPDVILLYSIWELFRNYTNNPATLERIHLLRTAFDAFSLIKNIELRHKLTSAAYKTFVQRPLEMLVILVETNSTIVNVKNSKLRDTLTRKELNMSEDCLEEFVQFSCDFSELMLQTCSEYSNSQLESSQEIRINLKEKLLAHDNWWSTPNTIRMRDRQIGRRKLSSEYEQVSTSLVKTILSTTNLLDVSFLVELNRLANLLNLIFRLKIIKAYPISLLGEESRQLLQLDLQQSPIYGSGLQASLKSRSSSLNELRRKFTRRCILNIVGKIVDESGDFSEENENLIASDNLNTDSKDIDTKTRKMTELHDQEHTPFVIAKQSNKSRTIKQRQTNKSSSDECTQIVPNYDDEDDDTVHRDEANEIMLLFTDLLSLAKEWSMNCDELHLELVFELYRCNLDKIASQISTRVFDKQTLASGLLKISSQRVLVLFGLSPSVSESSRWKRRVDIWSNFQPNVSGWLKSIQQEEIRREIASLSFSELARYKQNSSDANDGGVGVDDDEEQVVTDCWCKSFGVKLFVLHSLRGRTRIVLEGITNHLDGQAERLAYDLLELLGSQLFDKFIAKEAAELRVIGGGAVAES